MDKSSSEAYIDTTEADTYTTANELAGVRARVAACNRLEEPMASTSAPLKTPLEIAGADFAALCAVDAHDADLALRNAGAGHDR